MMILKYKYVYSSITNVSNNNENESPKSSNSDEESSNENTSNIIDTSNNNQLINWTTDDLVCLDDSEEKIYEDLCYVTISASPFPQEVSDSFNY
jgi:hypothetical protein